MNCFSGDKRNEILKINVILMYIWTLNKYEGKANKNKFR